MVNARRYQRYALSQEADSLDQIEVMVEGQTVRLVDFSVGGLYILSKAPLTQKEIKISVNFKERGKIDLLGHVVRVTKDRDMWGIAIDLTKTYDLSTLREV